jgi:MFS family permease
MNILTIRPSASHSHRSFASLHPVFVMSLCAIFVIYKYILQVFPGIMAHVLMNEFKMDGLTSGHLSSAFLYSIVITQLFVGYWLDRYNPVILTGSAILLCSIGVFSFGLAKCVYTAIIARTLMGIGGAFAVASYFKMANLFVPKHYFGLVNGLLATALTIGIVLGQVPFAWLLRHTPWRWILWGLSGLGGLLGMFFLIKGKDSLYPNPPLSALSMTTIEREDLLNIVKNPQNWILTIYNGLAFAPVGVFAGLWGIAFLKQSYQLEVHIAALLSACVFIGFGIGSPFMGWLADKTGKAKALMAWNSLISLGSVLIFLYCPHLPFLVLGSLLFMIGFSTGAMMLGFVVGKSINSTHTAATTMTLLNTGGVVVTAITEPLIGYLLDKQWAGEWLDEGIRVFSVAHYQKALMILPVYLIAAFILILLIHSSPEKKVYSVSKLSN